MSTRRAEQLSIPSFPSNEGRGKEGQAMLFTRDLPLAVMPIGGRRDRTEYAARLEPDDAHLTLWLANLLDRDETRAELANALAEFVESATQYLAHFGEAFYEIVPALASAGGADDKTREEPPGGERGEANKFPPIAGLVPLAPGKVRRIPWHYLQVVPKGDRARLGKRFVAIRGRRIWHLKLPREFGSPRAHRRMLERLERLDPLRPEFALQIGDMGRSVEYDVSVQRAACDIMQERATKDWGRILSITQIEGTTEFLFLARVLQWRRSQAVVREHVIAEFNRLLDRLGIRHRVVVNGLPTVDDIDQAIEQMHAGEITVADAMDATKI